MVVICDILKYIEDPCFIFTLVVILDFAAYFKAHDDKESYEYYHPMWHFIGGLCTLYMYVGWM